MFVKRHILQPDLSDHTRPQTLILSTYLIPTLPYHSFPNPTIIRLGVTLNSPPAVPAVTTVWAVPAATGTVPVPFRRFRRGGSGGNQISIGLFGLAAVVLGT